MKRQCYIPCPWYTKKQKKKTKRKEKQTKTKRQKDKQQFDIGMSGQFHTLAMIC